MTINMLKKSLQITTRYTDMLKLYAALTIFLTIFLLMTISIYAVTDSLYILLPALLLLALVISFFDLAIPFFIGSRIKNKKRTAFQCLKFAWSKKRFVFTHSLLRLLLAPLKAIEYTFAPLGKLGSPIVRPFEFLLGSLWQFSSSLTPSTVVFGKAKGIYSYRKTVLDTRKARGRKIRLRNNFWFEIPIYLAQIALAGYLAVLSVSLSTFIFISVIILSILIISATFSLFFIAKSTWYFALYIFLVSNKKLPPFSKKDFLKGAVQRV